MKLTLHAFDLPLRHRFTISRDSSDVQPTLVVELEHAGCQGYGEATSNSYYGFTIESMARALEAIRGTIESSSLLASDPVAAWDAFQPALADNPFAHCALDQAAHDLWGKLRKLPVYKLWGLSLDRLPASNYTLGIDSLEVMLAKWREFPDWPIYKIKLGTPHDLMIVTELRKHTTAVFRVDANCGWTVEQTLKLAPQLKCLGVEFIEQPLPVDHWQDYRRLRAESPLPIYADESCQALADVDRCAGHFHGVNIKLVKCGGLTPARRMIARARELGLQVMVGCMTESSVGISAIAQLLPLLDAVDMDGAVLLARDIATGCQLIRGVCHFPSTPGSGVTLLAPGRAITGGGNQS